MVVLFSPFRRGLTYVAYRAAVGAVRHVYECPFEGASREAAGSHAHRHISAGLTPCRLRQPSPFSRGTLSLSRRRKHSFCAQRREPIQIWSHRPVVGARIPIPIERSGKSTAAIHFIAMVGLSVLDLRILDD